MQVVPTQWLQLNVQSATSGVRTNIWCTILMEAVPTILSAMFMIIILHDDVFEPATACHMVHETYNLIVLPVLQHVFHKQHISRLYQLRGVACVNMAYVQVRVLLVMLCDQVFKHLVSHVFNVRCVLHDLARDGQITTPHVRHAHTAMLFDMSSDLSNPPSGFPDSTTSSTEVPDFVILAPQFLFVNL